MADDTNNLLLPYILASQSQKHVTHNDALRLLDGLVQMTVVRSDLTSPPGSPDEGACYIVAAGATGAWDTWDGDVAMYADGAWYRLVAKTGMRAWDQNASALLVRTGGGWLSLVEALGFIEQSASVDVAESSANDATTGMAVLEEDLSGLSGTTEDSSIEIPAGAVCIGVSSRVITAVTGATSFDVGIAGTADKFAAAHALTLGSTNKGVIAPEPFAAATVIRLTANGSDFTGGAVRIAIHYLTVGIPAA